MGYTLHVSIPMDYNQFNNLPAGRRLAINLPSGKELFGPDNFLDDLWMHPIMARLRIVCIPDMVAICCSMDNLDCLAEEVNIIQEHIDEIAAASRIVRDAIQPIVNNLREAVKLAKELNGDVGIW